MDKEKKLVIDEYIVRNILEMTIEITLRVLLKILEEKYLSFMKLYGKDMKLSKKEEIICKQYFKEAYIREANNRNLII